MPTGSGKTVVKMLAAVVLRAARVLVVTPSRMVREQIAHHFATLQVLRNPRVRIGGDLSPCGGPIGALPDAGGAERGGRPFYMRRPMPCRSGSSAS